MLKQEELKQYEQWFGTGLIQLTSAINKGDKSNILFNLRVIKMGIEKFEQELIKEEST